MSAPGSSKPQNTSRHSHSSPAISSPSVSDPRQRSLIEETREPDPCKAHSMIPRAPSLFHVEEGLGASTSTPTMAAASGAGELVGLRLIIQPSPRKQQPTVLRRSAMRMIPAATCASSKCGHENGRMSSFVGLEFLKRCFCCHKNLDATMDVFVYKGEQAFCSAECRCQHMAKEERREIEMLIRKRRDAFHRRHAGAAPKMQGSNRIMRLQTAAR